MKVFFVVFVLWATVLVAETPIGILGNISQELNQLDNKLLKELIEKKVKEAWETKDEAAKLAALNKILVEVKKLAPNKPVGEKGPVENDLQKEIALCNYLVQQACILEALDGRGVSLIRNELTGNFNDHGLSKEGQRLLRRLIELCEEGERGYRNVSFVEKDGSKSKAALLTTHIGTGVGVSLAFGDVTPLIASAIRIGRGYNNINRTKSRQLDVLIQAHQARITNFLFNVNSLKNDLIAEKKIPRNKIITPVQYRLFLRSLIEKDTTKRLEDLKDIAKSYPGFQAAWFYLAQTYFEKGELKQAGAFLRKVLENRNPLLHKDGFVGQAYLMLAEIDLQQDNFKGGVTNSLLALKENPSSARAYSIKSLSELGNKQFVEAWEDGLYAHKADNENSQYCWNLAKIASLHKKGEALKWLGEAISRGFRDFKAVRAWQPLKKDLESVAGKALLAPQLFAEYKPGIIKDDIVITNKSLFALEDFKGSVVVRYLKKQQWYNLEFLTRKELFAKGGAILFKSKFSMPKASQCKITISFTSRQNPKEVEVVVLYNHGGKKEHKFDWQVDVDSAWQQILQSDDKLTIEKAIAKLKEAAERGSQHGSHIFSQMAHGFAKLGNKEEAVKLQQKAIKILKETVPEKLYDMTVVPYRKALEKFEKFRNK